MKVWEAFDAIVFRSVIVSSIPMKVREAFDVLNEVCNSP